MPDFIALIATVCLAAQPGVCKDVTFTFDQRSVTPHHCLMKGQLRLSEWHKQNPAWFVRKYKCGRVKEEKDA